MRSYIYHCFLLLLTMSFMGCPSKKPAPQAVAQSDWLNFTTPKFAHKSFEEHDSELHQDAEAALPEIQALMKERAAAHAANPGLIPSDGKLRLERDFNQDFFEYSLRNIERFTETTRDPEKYHAAIGQLLKDFITAFQERPKARDFSEILAEAEQLVEEGSKDSNVVVVIALCHKCLGDKQKAVDVFTELASNEDHSPLVPLMELYFRGLHLTFSIDLKVPQGPLHARRYRLISAMLSIIEQGSFPDDLPYILALLDFYNGKLDLDRQEDFVMGMLESKQIPLVIQHYFAGKYYLKRAWERRGSGFANTVTQKGWNEFRKLLPKSRLHLVRAWQLAPDLPEPATELIAVANAGGEPDWRVRDWFLEGVRARFDNADAYSHYNFSLTPRWGGSHAQMIAFAKECVETNEWETRVPAMGAYLLDLIRTEIGYSSRIGDIPGAPEFATEYITGYCEASLKSDKVIGGTGQYLATCAVILTQAGEYDEVLILLDGFPTKFQAKDFYQHRVKLTWLKGLVYASTGPAAKQVAKWESALPDLAAGKKPELFAEMRDLLTSVREADSRPEVLHYLDDAEEVLRQYTAFHQDEWVELTFDENVSGFYIQATQHEVIDERTIELHSQADQLGVQLTMMGRFQMPICVQATVEELPESEAVCPDVPGIIFGTPAMEFRYREELMAFLTHRSQSVQWNTTRPRAQYFMGYDVQSDSDTQTIQVEMWPSVARFSVDGRLIMKDKQIGMVPQDLISFGEVLYPPKPTAIRLSNLRLRRLPTYVDEDAPSDQQIAFYEKLVEINPTALAMTQLATVLYNADRAEEALELLNQAVEMIPNRKSMTPLLVTVLSKAGRYGEANELLEESITDDPDNLMLVNSLAWNLATAPVDRDGERAVKLAEQVCNATGYNKWEFLDTLAVAYAENGQFDLAIETMDKCLPLTPEGNTAELKARRILFTQEKAYHKE